MASRRPSIRGASYLNNRTVGRQREEDFSVSRKAQEEIERELLSLDLKSVPMIPFDKLKRNPFQKHRTMTEAKLQELQANMEQNGITTTILGRWDPEEPGTVQIAYGHRRIIAAQRAGFTGYPVLIKELDDWAMRRHLIGENLHREDLTPMDYAYMAQDLMDEGLNQEDAGKELGMSRGTVRDHLSLLKDPPYIQDLVEKRHDTVRAARYIRQEPNVEYQKAAVEALLSDPPLINGEQVPSFIATLKRRDEEQSKQPPKETAVSETTSQEAAAAALNHAEETRTPSAPAAIAPVQEKAEIAQDREPSSPTTASLSEESKWEREELLDQSRLRTMNKNLTTIETRIKRRKENTAITPGTREQIKILKDTTIRILDAID